MTVTVNERHEVKRSGYLYTQNSAQRICCILRTGNAEIGLCPSLCHSRRIIVTALVAASTAIYAGQAGADLFLALVFLNAEEF